MELCLGVTGLDRFFTTDRMVSAYDVGVWKPDPAVFHLAAERLEVPIGRCAIVEDSPPGVAGAIASRAHTIALGAHDLDQDKTARVVSSLAEAQLALLGSDGSRAEG